MFGKRKKRKVFDLNNAILIDKIGDGFILSKSGTLTVGFKIKLLPLNCASAGDFVKYEGDEPGRELNAILQKAIKGLNPGTIFHQQDIVYYNTSSQLPDNEDYLNLSVRRFYGERAAMDNVTYFFITKKNIVFKDSGIQFDTLEINKFIDNVNLFKAAIDVLEPHQMQDEELLEYYESFFSCDFTNNSNKILQDLNFNNSTFGPYNMRGYALVGDPCTPKLSTRIQNPSRTTPNNPRYNSWVYPIFWDVPCYKIINNIIVRESEQIIRSEVRNFESKLGLFKTLAPGTMGAVSEYGDLTLNEACVPVYHHFSVFYLLTGTSPKELKASESFIDKAFTRVEAKPQQLTVDIEETFLATVGGCAAALTYPNQLANSFLDEAVCFSNLEGSYTQYQNGIVLADTKGSPVIVDVIFEPRLREVIPNNNWVIFGPSGTGKSVFTNKFVSSYLSLDFFFFIIDIGGSYKTLANLYGERARYIELDPEGKSLSSAPFLIDMIDPRNDPEHKLEEELTTLIELIFIAWNPNDDLDIRNENSTQTLRNLLYEFYTERYVNKRQYVNFDTFYDFVTTKYKDDVIDAHFFDVRSFLHIMKRYYSTEPYGYLFNGQKNIFDPRGICMIAFDLEKIAEQSQTIFRIITFMLINMATNIINNVPYRMKFLWLDEAWRLLSAAEFELFIKNQFKTIRKKGGGVGVITQEVIDIVNTTYGANIIGSSGSFAYLSHQGKESQLIEHQSALSLSDENLSLILSMNNDNHEVAIIQGGEPGRIFKVQLSAEELAAFNTTKHNVMRRQKLIQKYSGNVQLAIGEYISKTHDQ